MSEHEVSDTAFPFPSASLSWWARGCLWLWRGLLWVWGTFIVGIIISTIANFNTTSTNTSFSRLYLIHIVVTYPLLTLTSVGGLLLITLLSWIGSRKRNNTASLSPVQQNRLHMLQRLQKTYDDLLTHSLQERAWLELGLVSTPSAVQNTSTLLLRLSNLPERLIPAETPIEQVFEQAGRELLILGEPGAGKSTLLLKLGQQLVADERLDGLKPLPVLLPLSSWSSNHPPLEDWLAEQVAQFYNIPRLLANHWVQEGQLLPLLDGLDEMEETARAACIIEINTFHHKYVGPLVICSRQAEYETATKAQHLNVQSAILIQPLSREQIDGYLVQAGKPLNALRRALKQNAALAELTTTPLILHVLMLAYHGITVRELSHKEAELRMQIWQEYVRRMVEQNGNALAFPLEQTRSWLHWLASQMRQHDQPIFFLEHLQPDWLTERQRRAYDWLGVRLPAMIIGALISVLFGWFFIGSAGWSNFPWVSLLWEVTLGGMLGDLFCKLIPSAPTASVKKRRQRWETMGYVSIGIGLVIGLSSELSSYTTLNDWLGDASFNCLLFLFSTFLLQYVLVTFSRHAAQPRRPLSGQRVELARFVRQIHLYRALLVALLFGLSYMLSYMKDMWLGYLQQSSSISWAQVIPNWSDTLTGGMMAALSFFLASVLISVILEHLGETIPLTERVTWTWKNLKNNLYLDDHRWPNDSAPLSYPFSAATRTVSSFA